LNVPRCSLVYLVVEYEVSTLLSKDGSEMMHIRIIIKNTKKITLLQG